jgi:hypothetical protein
LLELPIDEVALEDARWSLCFRCGSTRVVSSVTIDDPVQNPGRDMSGWVCKQCYGGMLSLVYERKVIFGYEGFLSDNLTDYDEKEIVEKAEKFNELFEDKGCLAQLLSDNDFYYRMEIIVDDDQPELADAVKEAENMEKLCRHKIPFSRRRR